MGNPTGPGYYNQMRSLGQEYCAQPLSKAETYLTALAKNPPKEDEIHKECFGSAYIVAMLKEGFNLDTYSNYEVVREVNGGDIDWALGFAIVKESAGVASSGSWFSPKVAASKNYVVWAAVALLICGGAVIAFKKYRARK